MTERSMWVMLGAFSAATFLVTSSGPALAPFIQDVARDTHTELAAVANLFSLQAIVWAAASFSSGLLAERIGRKRILVATALVMGAMRVGFANAQSYPAALAWQALAGLAGGVFMGTVFASASDHVPTALRGRALSWIVMGQSLSLVIGVPLITLLGSIAGWRGALGTHGALTACVALLILYLVPRDAAVHPHAAPAKTPLAALARPRLMMLLGAGTTERMCFAVIAIYFPIFLQKTYGVPLASLALVLALVAAGNLIGNFVGGRIADRSRHRMRVFALCSLATAALALPLMGWHAGLAFSVAIGFAYSLVNALGRPAFLATLAHLPSELRGAVFGLNVTMASLGWLLAASTGSLFITRFKVESLGWFSAAIALLGVVLAAHHARREARGVVI